MQNLSGKRFVCLHGHFYQPPRENPWLGSIEVQDSARPFHDWNERINAECYAPNSRSRILDAAGRIVSVVNNYEFVSFDFGPTLLSWLHEHSPDVLKWVVKGDRLSCERHNGHGNALAQVYNHMIMPLASDRDKETQVKWGIADFQSRFGRDPEGMWLAETGVNVATLEVLAAHSIRFTVLSAHQAKEHRLLGTKPWVSSNGGIDTRRPYLCRLPSGRKISLFFYDPEVSHAIAFGRLLDNGEDFYKRILSRFNADEEDVQLVHIATDGESYGHHHRFGDMALAYVLQKLRKTPAVQITNYGDFLHRFPPKWEVRIHENSSWSCVHGIERWRADCGCNTGSAGWHQKWREPVRKAMDVLKGRLDQIFARKGAECFHDPWEARNAYIEVILNRQTETIADFLDRYGKQLVLKSSKVQALELLEMECHGMLMYTSCGWFFDDISGLEAVQNLKYACYAVQLARKFGKDLEGEFTGYLEQAQSNRKEYGNGRVIWETLVKPAVVDLERVSAHYAISSIYRKPMYQNRVYCFDITNYDMRTASHDTSALALGKLLVSSRVTLDEKEMVFAVMRFGSLDFSCLLKSSMSAKKYKGLENVLFGYFDNGSVSDIFRTITKEFPGKSYSLKDLFAEEQRKLIEIALEPRLKEYDEILEGLVSQDENVIKFLVSLSYPIPRQMLSATSSSLEREVLKNVHELPSPEALNKLENLWKRARKWNYQLEEGSLGRTLTLKLEGIMAELKTGCSYVEILTSARQVLEVSDMFGIPLNLWRCQNFLLDFCSECYKPASREKKELENFAGRVGLSKSILKWKIAK